MGKATSSERRRMRRWRRSVLLGAAVALIGVYVIDSARAPTPAPPAPTPPIPASPVPAPPVAWLGLNYNSGSGTGSFTDFATRGIVYDREGSLEVRAGSTPANDAQLRVGLDTSYAAGMVPDLAVDPAGGPVGCTGNPNHSKSCLPTSEAGIAGLVDGFVATAAAVVRDYPGKRVLFEPLDEPWNWSSPPGTPSGQRAATEYAAILAQLLPAARTSGIPLSDIYVATIGQLSDGSSWVADLYRARPCLKPGPGSCGPIAGWNLHPYGRPNSPQGIESVPRVRAQMRSGQDNIIVSEIGFCATNVDNGMGCDLNVAGVDGTSAQTAAWLSETLQKAAPMHQAGWLKALLVWERAGTGWAMQNANGSLTAQGRVLDLFAASPAGR